MARKGLAELLRLSERCVTRTLQPEGVISPLTDEEKPGICSFSSSNARLDPTIQTAPPHPTRPLPAGMTGQA